MFARIANVSIFAAVQAGVGAWSQIALRAGRHETLRGRKIGGK
jgi:hypothetical protein